MTTANDIIRHVESLAGHPLNPDEGVQHGDGGRAVSSATVAWTASPGALDAAGAAGDRLFIAHESLYYPYNVIHSPAPPPGWEDWPANRRRRLALERHRLVLLRLHGSVDEIAILDAFAELLGLGAPVSADGLVKVYEIPPCSFRSLAARVKERAGMSRVRVAPAGDPDRLVSRVGLPWGGLGLFVNVGYQQKLVARGCDVFISGESDSSGFRFAAESGVPTIETSHEVSENPGLRRFTAMLAEAFPDVAFRFHEEACVWRVE
jgi:putative NIF3 family GTP cyclohydrolase 1 type 2